MSRLPASSSRFHRSDRTAACVLVCVFVCSCVVVCVLVCVFVCVLRPQEHGSLSSVCSGMRSESAELESWLMSSSLVRSAYTLARRGCRRARGGLPRLRTGCACAFSCLCALTVVCAVAIWQADDTSADPVHAFIPHDDELTRQ